MGMSAGLKYDKRSCESAITKAVAGAIRERDAKPPAWWWGRWEANVSWQRFGAVAVVKARYDRVVNLDVNLLDRQLLSARP